MFGVLNFNWFLLLIVLVSGKALYHEFNKDDFQNIATNHHRNHLAHADIKDYPFMAKLQMRIGEFTFVCCGVLVDYDWVLTAAHCLEEKGKTVSKTEVCMGQTFMPSMELCAVKREAAEYVMPKKSLNADIAMVRLSAEFPNDHPNIHPLLPRRHHKRDLIGKTCQALGWGNMYEEITSPYLLQTKVSMSKSCIPHMLCMKSTLNGLCKGDSGGPLLCDGLLAGIATSSTNAACKVHTSTLGYEPIYRHYHFIMKTMHKNGCEANVLQICSIAAILIAVSISIVV